MSSRTRIMVLLAFAIQVVLLQDTVPLVLATAMSAVAALIFRHTVRGMLYRLRAVSIMLLMLVLTVPFSLPGRTLFSIGVLDCTVEGIRLAEQIALRASAIIFMTDALVGNLRPHELVVGLRSVGLPSKLVAIIHFLIRYAETLRREYQRITRAMRCRGFRLRCNMHALRSLGYLVGVLLVRSIDRSERVRDAMYCRGYTGTYTTMTSTRFCWKDALAICTVVALVTTLAITT